MTPKFSPRRIALSAFFASICAAPLAIFAETPRPEYPNDPPLDVCPVEIEAYHPSFAFEFDAADDFVGWGDGPNAKVERGDGTLKIVATQNDPYVFSPVLNLIATDANSSNATFSHKDLVGTILVKLRMKTTAIGFGQIFTAEEAKPDYAEERSTRFSLISDGAYHDYCVAVETRSPLLRLRLDPGGDLGGAEIERFELVSVVERPAKFGVFSVDGDALTFELLNRNAEKPTTLDLEFLGADQTKPLPVSTVDVANAEKLTVYFPQKKAFEELEVVATVRETGVQFSRRFFAFHESVADASQPLQNEDVPTLRGGAVEVRFAPDASGAEIFRDGTRVAVLTPLLCEDGDGSKLVPPNKEADYATQTVSPSKLPTTRLRPVFRSLDDSGTQIEFNVCDLPRSVVPDGSAASRAVGPSTIRGALRFRLDGDVLSFEVDAPRAVHSPILRVLGTMKQSQLSGIEYLEEGEHSSSTADVGERDRARFAPTPLWATSPFASFVTDRGSVSFLYDDANRQVLFAVPNFLDGDAKSCRVNVCDKLASGKIRFAAPEPLEETILWSVQELGLPDVPPRPRTDAEQDALHRAAFEISKLKMPGGWAHAVGDGLPTLPFDPHYGSDFISTIWELTGELPQTPRFDVGGGHIRNYSAFLIAGKADQFLRWINAEAAGVRAKQKADGSFRYSGVYLRGHWTDFASGNCANYTFTLLDHWRLTGNKDSLNAALKGLAFLNKLKTPRGAQVWELSLHTPDIMGSSRGVLSNVLAFEATGDRQYLAAARRWALSGLPFVYRWEKKPLAENDSPIMLYATTPVLGATNWIAPNWIGLPVQWCGLDYAHSLILLAPHDTTLDWRKIAEGIVVSAEQQEYPDGDFIGLLPDSFTLADQIRNQYNINPCAVHMLRKMLNGVQTSVCVVDVDGRRVLSPFPATAENGALRVAAKKGVRYQIVVDGEEIRTIESQGTDVVSFE